MSTPLNTIIKLEEIRDLISIPERWTQGLNARDSNGARTWPTKPNAVCWCLLGAVRKVTKDDWETANSINTLLLSEVLDKNHIFIFVSDFNDNVSHGEVLSLLDNVIKKVKKEDL